MIHCEEGLIIACIFWRPDKASEIIPYLKPEFFSKAKPREIFKIITQLKQINLVEFSRFVKINKLKISAGDISEIIENYDHTLYPIKALIKSLRERAEERLLKERAVGDIKNVQKALNEIRDLFDDGFEKGELQPADILENMYNKREKGEMYEGYSTGYSELDKYVKGLIKGKFIAISGYNSHGKSTFAINLMSNALKQGANCMYITIEMSEEEVLSRLLACRADLTIEELMKKTTNENKENKIKQAYADLAQQSFSVISGLDDVDDILMKIASKKPEVVFVDYMQNMSWTNSKRIDMLEYASKEFKVLSLKENVCIVGLSQIGEEAMKNVTFTSGIKGSGDVSIASDATIRIHRPWRDEKLKIPSNKVSLMLVKNRYGPTAMLDFIIETTKGKIFQAF